MELASCYLSGAQNFEVAPTFMENLCTPVSSQHHGRRRCSSVLLIHITQWQSYVWMHFWHLWLLLLKMVTFGWHRSAVPNLFSLVYLLAAYFYLIHKDECLFVCFFVCLFVPYTNPHFWTDRNQTLHTSPPWSGRDRRVCMDPQYFTFPTS